MVAKAKQHITDGDVFQVVLSQAFHEEVSASALEVYRVLRQVNPSPYMYLLECETTSGVPYQVVGSSPEALVTISHGKVVSHPIAGSRPRGQTPGEDAEFAQSLQDDAKEKAEHLMLVDLARNDLSKVAKTRVGGGHSVHAGGTVQPHHALRSTVEGTCALMPPVLMCLRQRFPAGTLSGAT